jgi:hypothetical protein
MKSLVTPVRLGQVRKVIKSSIIEPLSFLCPFSKLRKIQQKRGYPRSVRGMKERSEGSIKPC